MKITKKILIFFIIFNVFFAQSAYAIIGFVFTGARIAAPFFTTPAGSNIAAGGLVGAGMYFSQMHADRVDGAGTHRQDDIYYTNQPRPASREEMDAGFTAGYPSVTPASSAGAPSITGYSNNFGGVASSVDASCALMTTGTHTYSGGSQTGSNTWNCTVTYLATGATFMGGTITGIFGCPSGYTLSSGSCVLSNAAAVPRPADNHCPINRSGNSYSADTTDPDCSAGMPPTFAADGSFEISDAEGRKITGQLTGPNERKITYTEPDVTKNTTHVREIIMDNPTDASTAPRVTGVRDAEYAGTGSGMAVTPTATTSNTTVNVDLQPVVDAVNADKASREAWNAGEAARVAADRAADRDIPDDMETPKEFIPFSVSPIGFASNAACPSPIAFGMMGKNYTIDYVHMCSLMATLRPLFLALGAFGAAFIFIGGLRP